MSRHSELFDHLAQENGLFGSSNFPKPRTPRGTGPLLATRGRCRTEIEKVVNRLCQGPAAETFKVVVFTSFEPGNGCSSVCAYTGDLLAARSDASVCLVDANLRTPTLHEHVGLPNRNGLTNLIDNSALRVKSIACKLSGRQLWLLTSGPTTEDETECLVQSDRMRDRINELRSSFDWVLIDAPAVSLCNDALALGQLADGVVLVVRAGATRRGAARQVTTEFAASGIKIIGAVLNDYSSPIPDAVDRWI